MWPDSYGRFWFMMESWHGRRLGLKYSIVLLRANEILPEEQEWKEDSTEDNPKVEYKRWENGVKIPRSNHIFR